MIGRIRRKLREIEYHSARRPTSRWSHLNDLWLMLSLPVAIGVVCVVGLITRAPSSSTLAIGIIWRGENGALGAAAARPGKPLAQPGRFVAGFDVREDRTTAGWPITFYERTETSVIVMSDSTGAKPLTLDGETPEEVVVRRALERFDESIVEALGAPPHGHLHTGSILGAVLTTWIALLPLGLAAILAMRFTSSYAARLRLTRRARREARNLCPSCGYSLVGIEFQAKCPECGEILL